MTILPHPSAVALPLSGPALQLIHNHRKSKKTGRSRREYLFSMHLETGPKKIYTADL